MSRRYDLEKLDSGWDLVEGLTPIYARLERRRQMTRTLKWALLRASALYALALLVHQGPWHPWWLVFVVAILCGLAGGGVPR